MGAFGFLSLVYSISLQIRHTPFTNNFFQGIATLFLSSLLLGGSKFPKKQGLKFSYHRLANRRRLILTSEKYFKTWKDMISGTVGA